MAHLTSEDGSRFAVDKLPNICPKCKHIIAPMQMQKIAVISNFEVESIFFCPGCRRFFFATYKRRDTADEFRLEKLEPSWPTTHSFGTIDAVSPGFVELYNQATSAEDFGLTQIAGGGYRKALEFLIKDYCIRSFPEKQKEIEARPLLQVINEYLDDGKIKEAAKRTAWLGNDEIHYTRRWEDKDLNDLKNLLRLTRTGIAEKLEFDAYMISMDAPH